MGHAIRLAVDARIKRRRCNSNRSEDDACLTVNDGYLQMSINHRILCVRTFACHSLIIKKLEEKADHKSLRIYFFHSKDVDENYSSESVNNGFSSSKDTQDEHANSMVLNFNSSQLLASFLIQEYNFSHSKKSEYLHFHENMHANYILWRSTHLYLTDLGIDSIIFMDLPRTIHEVTLYQVAKETSKNVLILSQPSGLKYYFSFCSLNDFGDYTQQTRKTPNDGLPLIEEQTDYYMQQFNDANSCKENCLENVSKVVKFLARVQPLKLINPFYIMRRARHLHDAPLNVDDWSDPFARFFFCTKHAYFEFLSNSIDKSNFLNCDFVYFPLQSRHEIIPELLFNRYADQALAIEQLARMIPKTWKIYIKSDQPNCSDYLSPMFFHRIRRIVNVVRIPSCTSSTKLIEASKFVATVGSLDGWKALVQRKSLLVFGKPWYWKLPGVLEYQVDLTFNEVIDKKTSEVDFDRELRILFSQSHTGTLLVQNVNNNSFCSSSQQNAEYVSSTLIDLLLGRKRVSFRPLS